MCDPCEKETVDALGEVTMQEREDLTASAQVDTRVVMIILLKRHSPTLQQHLFNCSNSLTP